MKVKVYGAEAKQIQDGQQFIAKVGYVEGRAVVTLESI